jgi:3-oxoacyl-[acyl-carrier protein] reductase
MDLQLKGRKAIVTGATKGIGLCIARMLADEGVDVAICARTAADVQATEKELASKGIKAYGDAVDVQDREAFTRWIESACKRLGGLDIFVSNTTGTPGLAGETGWKATFEIDVMGAVRGVDTALPYLRKSSSGAVVFIGSISGVLSKMIPAPGAYSYGAGKAALIAYGAMLSKQVAKDGIRVNTVSPGPIYFKGGAWDRIEQHAPAVMADAQAHCVIGRLGKPEDVAAAVLFLASPVSGFTIGQNLHVDGGYCEHVPF